MMKHTAGPWIVEAQGIYANGGNKRVATAMSHEHEIDWPTTTANARLIAAAPELLEALRKFALKHRCTYGLDGAWDEEITMAENAIAKATGESK